MSGQRIAQRTKPFSARLQGFRQAGPMGEGLIRVSADEIMDAFRAFFPRDPSGAYHRFAEAQETLRDNYGGRLEIVRAPGGGLRTAARLEISTADRTIDTDLDSVVSGMGFDLSLMKMPAPGSPPRDAYERFPFTKTDGTTGFDWEPRTERTYVVTEGRHSSGIDKALHLADAALSLAAMLAPRRELPENVVEITSARASRPPQPPEAAKGPETGSGRAG